MKNLAIVIFLAVVFCPINVLAEEKLVDEVIRLCAVNATMADKLNARLDKDEAKLTDFGYHPRIFVDISSGETIGKVPTSIFFFMIADLVRRDQKINGVVVRKLITENRLLYEALKNGKTQNFVTERIK